MLPAYADREPSRAFRFVATDLDRRADLREDAAFQAAARHDPTARFLVFAGDRPLVRDDAGYLALQAPDTLSVEIAEHGGHCGFLLDAALHGYAERWVAQRLAAALVDPA